MKPEAVEVKIKELLDIFHAEKSIHSFRELAGQNFWTEITGDEEFYLKISDLMRDHPARHREIFSEKFLLTKNRF